MKRSHFKKGVSRCGHRILEDPFPVRAARTTQANNTFSLRDLVLLQGSVVEGGGLPTKGRLRSSVQLHQRASVRYVACLIHV